MYLSRVFIFAIVWAPHDGLLLPHPRLGLIGISKVLLGLQGVLQILSPLRGLSLQCVPAAMQFSQLNFHFFPSKMPWEPHTCMISFLNAGTVFQLLKRSQTSHRRYQTKLGI